ncbi:hypothetical protein AHAS_Ahas01G0118100 [Arachis hypogaea]
MATLMNAVHANTVATNQVLERMNRNGNGLRNHHAGGGPMALATFLKVNPPTFRRSTNPTEADNCGGREPSIFCSKELGLRRSLRGLLRGVLQEVLPKFGEGAPKGYEE